MSCEYINITFYSSSLSVYSPSATFRQTEKKILDSIIGEGHYDSRIRPSGVALNKSENAGDDVGKIHFFLLIFVITRKLTLIYVVSLEMDLPSFESMFLSEVFPGSMMSQWYVRQPLLSLLIENVWTFQSSPLIPTGIRHSNHIPRTMERR